MEQIRLTPLSGGRSESGVCSLLEIGGSRILLDCGLGENVSPSHINSIIEYLKSNGGVDLILLSHADAQHMSGLPILFGTMGLENVPIVCTLPVYKFGQMMLYDMYLNKSMEGVHISTGVSTSRFELDDVDKCFDNITTVRYNQMMLLDEICKDKRHRVNVCAYSSGRTIGGSIWRIRHGATEVIYAMDINLKKGIVLDGASLDMLPVSPALMILEGCSQSHSLLASSGTGSLNSLSGSGGMGSRAKTTAQQKLQEDYSRLIHTSIDTLRNGGNVLIPCETSGRILELLQIFGKYWLDHKVGNYHLVFLSPMAHNIIEFARSQLEWMSDALAKGFYNGRANPFELPQLRVVTSVRELEGTCVGPKVVIATDCQLSSGPARSLLLRWGGDPRCKVIFVDVPEEHTLAAELQKLLATAAPMIVTVTAPRRVELEGKELEDHRAQKLVLFRLKEEEVQRKLQANELALLNDGLDLDEDEAGDDSDNEDNEDRDRDRDRRSSKIGLITGAHREEGEEHTSSAADNMRSIAGVKRDIHSSSSDALHGKRQKSRITGFIEPSFPMFQSREHVWSADEYGVFNNDLAFQDIITNQLTFKKLPPLTPGGPAAVGASISQKTAVMTKDALTEELEQLAAAMTGAGAQAIPWKLVATPSKVQLTCEFSEHCFGSGRADFKTIKTLIAKVAPQHIISLRGNVSDTQQLLQYCTTSVSSTKAFAVDNFQTIVLNVTSNRVRLQVPQALLASSMRTLTSGTGPIAGSGDQEGVFRICGIEGSLVESMDSGRDGVRVVKLQASDVAKAPAAAASEMMEDEDQMEADAMAGQTEITGNENDDNNTLDVPLELMETSVGAISIGEVMLNKLKTLIEQQGVQVEFKLSSAGGMLVCGSQVFVRKVNDNDFCIEGPPVSAFYAARRALYKQFAFI